MKRLRFVLTSAPRVNPKFTHTPDALVSFAPMDALADGLGGLSDLESKAFSEVAGGSYNYFEDGDVLLAKVTPCFENGKKAIARDLENGAGFATSEVLVFRPDSNEIDTRYLRYLFCSENFRHSAIASMTGAGGLRRVSERAVLDFPLCITDLATQRQIADFLDRETARIDLLIEKKQRLVEVQKTRLVSLLRRLVLGGATVRRGLYGEWLHDLPVGWALIPLKHLVKISGGATPSKDRDDFWNGDIPWVAPKDMKSDLIMNAQHRVSEEAVASSALQVIPDGGVLIVVRGMILARTVPVCRLGMPATINQDMKALLPREDRIRGDFLQRMLQGFEDILMSFVEEAAHGTKKLRSEALFGLKFPVPPMTDQKDICGEYEKARIWTEKLNAATLASIDRLKEYRAGLITAAVTGQIEVATYGKAGTTSATLDRIEEEMQA